MRQRYWIPRFSQKFWATCVPQSFMIFGSNKASTTLDLKSVQVFPKIPGLDRLLLPSLLTLQWPSWYIVIFVPCNCYNRTWGISGRKWTDLISIPSISALFWLLFFVVYLHKTNKGTKDIAPPGRDHSDSNGSILRCFCVFSFSI